MSNEKPPYDNLRERSPVDRTNPHHTSSQNAENAGSASVHHPADTSYEPTPYDLAAQNQNPNSQFATSMVRQSLADLKQRLHQMRKEKQQVEQELSNYENHL